MEWFTFQARKEVLGIDAQHVYRVVDDVKVTPVPLTPECHLGLIYYRGELFTVIDIINMLGYGKANVEKNAPIILVKWSDKNLALVSDQIGGLLWIEDEAETLSTYGKGNHTVRPITPETIWNTLLKFSYGPDQIPEDFHRGI
ncbi:MAG: chemotaxis protein CheW [Deltaproteobacteria bacterium]|nr:chemotaxis protein CheW [Deltaproteobacteria bacterium]